MNVRVARRIIKALSIAHDKMDDLNAELGEAKLLCLFCGSFSYNALGIVHTDLCAIAQVRVAQDLMRKMEGDQNNVN